MHASVKLCGWKEYLVYSKKLAHTWNWSYHYRIFSYHIVSDIKTNMKTTVYNFKLSLTWEHIRLISQIDRFDASWTSIERREGQSLKQLKSIATVRSVGASIRYCSNIVKRMIGTGAITNSKVMQWKPECPMSVARYSHPGCDTEVT